MTTKTAGGKIMGQLALTFDGAVAFNVGDFVHVSADYTVALADGTKPVIGWVSVKNVTRTSTVTTSQFPTPNPGGQITVEALGFAVKKCTAGGSFAAGTAVGINSSGAIVAVGANVTKIGVALMASTGAGTAVDVLLTSA